MPRKRTVVNREELDLKQLHKLERIREHVRHRNPGEALTKQDWLAMGYGIGGHQERNHGDAPIGWEAHRKVDPEAPV